MKRVYKRKHEELNMSNTEKATMHTLVPRSYFMASEPGETKSETQEDLFKTLNITHYDFIKTEDEVQIRISAFNKKESKLPKKVSRQGVSSIFTDGSQVAVFEEDRIPQKPVIMLEGTEDIYTDIKEAEEAKENWKKFNDFRYIRVDLREADRSIEEYNSEQARSALKKCIHEERRMIFTENFTDEPDFFVAREYERTGRDGIRTEYLSIVAVFVIHENLLKNSEKAQKKQKGLKYFCAKALKPSDFKENKIPDKYNKYINKKGQLKNDYNETHELGMFTFEKALEKTTGYINKVATAKKGKYPDFELSALGPIFVEHYDKIVDIILNK